MPALGARLDLLEQALLALKKGDVLDFTFVPETGTVVRGQGKEMCLVSTEVTVRGHMTVYRHAPLGS
jgi:hypothetical protein